MESDEPSVLILTKACISKFEELLALHGPRHTELESRLADFCLWADSVGALSKPGSSLDSRLQGRFNDLALVRNVLNTLVDSLDYAKNVAESERGSDESIRNLDSAIGNLALIGVAIRRTGKASRNRRADLTFDPDEHPDFRTHLECIVLLRPTEAALFHQNENGDFVADLDPSKLSPLQNRLVDANLRRRHKFNIAQKKSKHQKEAHVQVSASMAPLAADDPLRDGPPPSVQNVVGPKGLGPHLITKDPSRPEPTISGFSLASTAEGTLKYAPAVKRGHPGVAKTQITSIAADAEFPKPPPIPLVDVFTNPMTWKQHIIEDLCPYTCVAENCPTPQLLFCTRSEWENHVRQSHLPRWQCPFCDEHDAIYPTMESMGSHIQIEHKDELLETSFSTIISWSAVQTMGIKSCPLCDSCGPEDCTELVDHVLQHTYEFALRALPWPPTTIQDLNVLPGSFNVPGDTEHAGDIPQWINGAMHEKVEISRLALCDYDRADHLFPAPNKFPEYSDYFLTNDYFNESPGDRSSEPQTGQSVHLDISNSHVSWDHSDDGNTRRDSGNTDAFSQSAETTLYDRLKTMVVFFYQEENTETLSQPSFLPLDALNRAITPDIVKAQLVSEDDFNQIFERSKKVFAILGFVGTEARIRDLFKDGLLDEHLPLERIEDAQQSELLRSRRQGREFKSFSKWGKRDIDDFLRRQWLVLAPVFTTRGEHIDIDGDTPLPLYDITVISVTKISIMYSGILHAAHIVPRPTFNFKVAVKSYVIQTDFYKEKKALSRILTLRHPHLIQHIATIQRGNLFCIIFPWANGGSLCDFWRSYPDALPTRSFKTFLWCFQQMAGLVDGLFPLHRVNYRHDDLGPYHILHFNDQDNSSVCGTLVIAGFRHAIRHHISSELRHDPEMQSASSLLYEPPEAESPTPRPRRYDMWSIGCIFMEFAIWLLYGYNAIDKFRKLLGDREIPWSERGAFYKSTEGDTKIIHPVVSRGFDALRNDPRCAKGTGLEGLVSLISNDLIVIDPGKRANAETSRDKLREIVRKAEKDPSYLMKNVEPPPEIPDMFAGEI
ncbi:hypothetical protein EKO27_g5509 [Xylaria grammica]|uniref:Protein kinase domain-containing protein n=1 Tax=Xylaria grammica TaxID=363999 RepID=A0A439D5A1_9PEZI|nr:hypothetical protein EKO27_g5509 [Xylaria grammica]